jgi:hypothetical protein
VELLAPACQPAGAATAPARMTQAQLPAVIAAYSEQLQVWHASPVVRARVARGVHAATAQQSGPGAVEFAAATPSANSSAPQPAVSPDDAAALPSSLELYVTCAGCGGLAGECTHREPLCADSVRWPAGLRCCVCEVPVRGVATMCPFCGHGGHRSHLQDWFAVQSECPSGCGCRCLAAGREFNRIATSALPPAGTAWLDSATKTSGATAYSAGDLTVAGEVNTTAPHEHDGRPSASANHEAALNMLMHASLPFGLYGRETGPEFVGAARRRAEAEDSRTGDEQDDAVPADAWLDAHGDRDSGFQVPRANSSMLQRRGPGTVSTPTTQPRARYFGASAYLAAQGFAYASQLAEGGSGAGGGTGTDTASVGARFHEGPGTDKVTWVGSNGESPAGVGTLEHDNEPAILPLFHDIFGGGEQGGEVEGDA